MNGFRAEVTLSYSGEDSDASIIDFYDVSQALLGFQRSLALTTHLILNGEIITQAPGLKGAKIFAYPAEDGSWKFTAVIIAGLYSLSTAPQDTPLGHLIYSAYDYVISQSLGFHVDYSQSLGKQYDAVRSVPLGDLPTLDELRFDSLLRNASRLLSRCIGQSCFPTPLPMPTY